MGNSNRSSLVYREMPAVQFSIVIPYFNKSEYICRAVYSVLNQTYSNFELIIVDDGSTDNGAEQIKAIDDSRIRVICQENRGEAGARNRGIEEASNEFISFLDADDEWTPQYLETICRLIEKHPHALIFCTDYKILRSDGKERMTPQVAVPPPPFEGIISDYFLSAALGGPSVSASSATIRKATLNLMGGFKTGYWYGCDTDLWGRIALQGDIAFSWYIGAIYHEDANNRVCTTKRIITHPFIEEGERALSEMVGDLKHCHLSEYLTVLKMNMACRLIQCGRNIDALKILLHCKTSFFQKQKIFWILWSMVPPKFDWPLRQMSIKFRQFVYNDQ